jgi:hypothetical protein
MRPVPTAVSLSPVFSFIVFLGDIQEYLMGPFMCVSLFVYLSHSSYKIGNLHRNMKAIVNPSIVTILVVIIMIVASHIVVISIVVVSPIFIMPWPDRGVRHTFASAISG